MFVWWQVLVFAGDTGAKHGAGFLRDLWQFNPLTLQWKELTNSKLMPSARRGHVAVTLSEQMLVFAGKERDGTPLKDLWSMRLCPAKFDASVSKEKWEVRQQQLWLQQSHNKSIVRRTRTTTSTAVGTTAMITTTTDSNKDDDNNSKGNSLHRSSSG